MYVPEALWCIATVTLRSKGLRQEEAIDPDVVTDRSDYFC